MKNQAELANLFTRYLANECSLEEVEELMHYFNSENGEFLEQQVANAFDSLDLQLENYSALPEHIFEGVKSRIARTEPRSVHRKLWPRIVAAASILLICSLGFYFYRSSNVIVQPNLVTQQDINPGKNGATLTLANGLKILIKDALVGNIANQSGVKISKTTEGQIIYAISSVQTEGINNTEVQYNTLSTTRGEQTQVRLPDGTLVFLNAESSLTYPTSFIKSEKRQVSLIGEGYFEVAKDKAHPFIVKTEKQNITVLGTHFNINAYGDEESVKTTLVEGSVKVSSLISKSEIMLKPGQQSALDQGDIQITQANLEETLAWKNGRFRFDDKSIAQIMRQIARWYDVTIVFDGQLPEGSLDGSISRSRKLSQVLKMMEKTKEVKFRIDGRKIYVEKYN